ncbi:MAG: hypothetical protein ACI39G_05810 [Pseudoramibacter sp.]
MNLKQYWGQYIKIVTNNDHVVIGKATDYVYPDDNENNKESLIIDVDEGWLAGFPVEAYEKDIKTIEILNKGKG